MSEVTKLAMVREYWKHADAGLAGEFARMHEGFRFYTGDQWDLADLEKLQGYEQKRAWYQESYDRLLAAIHVEVPEGG